jgi:Homeodomain-like domain
MKLIIDLDDPDPLPLKDWLQVLQRARILYEVDKSGTMKGAARRLGISRYTVQRICAFAVRPRKYFPSGPTSI